MIYTLRSHSLIRKQAGMLITVLLEPVDERLMLDLAAYIAEHLPVVPVLKHDRIVLDEISHVEFDDASSIIGSFLEMRGMISNCRMSADHERREITITLNESMRDGSVRDAVNLFICPHCNYTSEDAEILNIHIRVHYL